MNTTKNRILSAAIGIPAMVAALSACSMLPGSHVTATIDTSAGPAGVGPSATAGQGSTTAGSTQGSTGPTSAGPTTGASLPGPGCTSGEAQLPRGVKSVKTADLDGDGKADRIWLYNNNSSTDLKRYVGVVFAAGGGTSTTFVSADPQTATAVAGLLDGGNPMVMLDTGRSVHLYAVVGCKLVKTENQQGQQYTFDKGFTGYGTGVGCPVIGSAGQQLVGYLAGPAKGDVGGRYYKVTRTTVDISDSGRRATNGTTVTLGTKLGADSEPVRTAFQVACGSSGQAKEGDS